MSNVTDEYVRQLLVEVLKGGGRLGNVSDTPSPRGHFNFSEIERKLDTYTKKMGERYDKAHETPLRHPLSLEGLVCIFFLILTILTRLFCFYCKNRECLKRMCKGRDRREVLLESDLPQ